MRISPEQYFQQNLGYNQRKDYLYPLVIIALVAGLIALGMSLAILLKK